MGEEVANAMSDVRLPFCVRPTPIGGRAGAVDRWRWIAQRVRQPGGLVCGLGGAGWEEVGGLLQRGMRAGNACEGRFR